MAFHKAGEGILPALTLSTSLVLAPVAPALAQADAPQASAPAASAPQAPAQAAAPASPSETAAQPEGKEVALPPVEGGETALASAAATALVNTVQDPKKPSPAVPFTGSYNYSVPIAVPAFRGLEPKLSLTYSSSRGVKGGAELASGWLGAGWSLDGFSSIQRKTRKFGAVPVYGADTDSYYLDGEELIPCA